MIAFIVLAALGIAFQAAGMQRGSARRRERVS
jgi:hypothetical protein